MILTDVSNVSYWLQPSTSIHNVLDSPPPMATFDAGCGFCFGRGTSAISASTNGDALQVTGSAKTISNGDSNFAASVLTWALCLRLMNRYIC